MREDSTLNMLVGTVFVYTCIMGTYYSGYRADKFYTDKVYAEKSVQYLKENRAATDSELEVYLKQQDISMIKRGSAMVFGGGLGLFGMFLGASTALKGIDKLTKK